LNKERPSFSFMNSKGCRRPANGSISINMLDSQPYSLILKHANIS
jgi:hypothetical protein